MQPSLRLKKNEEKRLKQGHLWVYSNEVDTKETPLKSFEAGQLVTVEASTGKALGLAYINPNTLICARMLSRDCSLELNLKFLKKRFQAAQALRELSYEQPYYRLIHAESDGLPGLVVDRFGDVFSVQISTAGMEAVKETVVQVIENLYHPQAIVFKNDLMNRETEGLERYESVVQGELPEQIEIVENGTRFAIPVVDGQKTGWFYDHRDARAQLAKMVQGKRVLDLFSYLGGWGITAAVAGAESVTCVDASASALDGVELNARLNGVEDKLTCIQGNVFDVLKVLKQEGEKFDVVIVDPPAFIKRRKDFKQGFEGYKRVNSQAMRVLERDGILVSASCSHHLGRDDLLNAVQQAGRHLDRQVQLFAQAHQAADHPVHPAIPETEYIKTLFFKVGMSW